MSTIRKVYPNDDAERGAIESAMRADVLVALQRIFDRIKPKTDLEIATLGGTVASEFVSLIPVLVPHIQSAADLALVVAEYEREGTTVVMRYAADDLAQISRQRAAEVARLMGFNTAKAIRKKNIDRLVHEQSIPEFVAALRPQFGENRALLVGVTETTEAFNRAMFEIFSRSTTSTHYQWLSANDHRVCPICAGLSGIEWSESNQAISMPEEYQIAFGQVRLIGQPFVHPGGGGAQAKYRNVVYDRPPAHIGCRCRLIEWME